MTISHWFGDPCRGNGTTADSEAYVDDLLHTVVLKHQ
jgi:hypothetical protein